MHLLQASKSKLSRASSQARHTRPREFTTAKRQLGFEPLEQRVQLNGAPVATTTVLTSSSNPSAWGQQVTFTADVAAAGGVTPTGSVLFVSDAPIGGSRTLDNGKATLTTDRLSLGSHTVQAFFTSNDAFLASSASMTQTVVAAPTTTTITSSSNPSAVGLPVTFTATVSAAPSRSLPTGSVIFNVDGVDAAPIALAPSGGLGEALDGTREVTFTISTLTLGTHTVFARYATDSANFTNSASANLTQVVNVATVQNGTLRVEGTSDDEIVTITGVGTGTGVYVVTLQRGAQPPLTQTLTGVTQDINVNLLAGNDQLTMNNVYLNGSIDIDMGVGDDSVTLGHADVVSTRGDLSVVLGAGSDALNGRRIFIAGDQTHSGGEGNDSLTFDGFASPFTLGTSAGGSANLATGDGDDAVSMVYAFIVGALAIDLGQGADSFNIFGSAVSGDVSVAGGLGDNAITVDTNFLDASLLIAGGDERDTVFVANGLGLNAVTINSGAGADLITVRNETAGRLEIDAGAGGDTVDVRSSVFDRLFALLGDDDDQLTMFTNVWRFEMSRDGGPGLADRLLDFGNLAQGTALTRNFELFGDS